MIVFEIRLSINNYFLNYQKSDSLVHAKILNNSTVLKLVAQSLLQKTTKYSDLRVEKDYVINQLIHFPSIKKLVNVTITVYSVNIYLSYSILDMLVDTSADQGDSRSDSVTMTKP